MRVYLDNDSVPIATPTLAAALAAVRESAEKSGRVVVEVLRDGQVVPQSLLESPTDVEEPEVELRCASADPRRLVADSLRQAGVELAAARGIHTSAADAIQTGRLDDAMPHLSSAMEVWTRVYRVVIDGSSLVGLDLSTDVQGRPVSQSVQGLAGRLTEIKRSLQAQDWSGLADTLAYDLPDEAARWQVILNTLADRVAGER